MKTIFVSSTFRDMQHERDAIQEIVHPRINTLANEYGESISFCDLRWGINTEELESDAGSRKVLEVCLDEIDRCQPPMVVILGDRYGWIPGEELIGSAAERKQIHLDDLRKSVTALEIEYGALSSADRLENTLFYFRNIVPPVPEGYEETDEQHSALLRELKQRIRKLTGGKIKAYTVRLEGDRITGIDTFADMLASDLEAMLKPEWERSGNMTPLQREQYTHQSFVTSKAAMFRARKPLAEKYLRDLQAENALIIRGQPGLGKSTLISYLITQLQAERTVVPVICGLTSRSNTAADVLRHIVLSLEELLSVPHFLNEDDTEKAIDIKRWRERLDDLCDICASKEISLTIAIDAIDQLFPDDNLRKLIFIPSRLSSSVQLLMTCLPSVALNGRRCQTLEPVNDAEKHRILTGILDAQRRELAEPVIRAIVQKTGSHNPLYLSLLTQRLLMMNKADFEAINASGGGMSAITAHQLKLVESCPDTLEELSIVVMQIAAERINGPLMVRCIALLAHSRHGLRPTDLMALLPDSFNRLDFSHFISYLGDCFLVRDDGRYDFSHKSFRQALLKQGQRASAVHQQLYHHFASLDQADPVAAQETGYHAILAGDADRFRTYVHDLYCRNDRNGQIHTGQALYQTVMDDRGTWLSGLLKNAPGSEEDLHLLQLLHDYFSPHFTHTYDEDRILPGLLHRAKDLADLVCENLGTPKAAWVTADIYDDYSKNLPNSPDVKKHRFQLRRDAVRLLECIPESDRDRETKIHLAEAYRQLGYQYQISDAEYTYPTAAEYYGKALAIFRKLEQEKSTAFITRYIAMCCDDLAEIYNPPITIPFTPEEDNLRYSAKKALTTKRRLQAIEYANEAAAIRQKLVELDPTFNNQLALSHSYGTLAAQYATHPAPGSRAKVIRLRTQQKELLEKLAWESRSISMNNRLADCLMELGHLYATSFEQEDYITAFRCYQDAGKLLIERFNALRTPASGLDYFSSRLYLGRMLYQVGGEQNCVNALRVAEEAHGFFLEHSDLDSETRNNLILHLDDLITASKVALGQLPYPGPETKEDKLQFYAFAEILEILRYLSWSEPQNVDRIPVNFLRLMHRNSLKSYRNHIDPQIPIEKQELFPATVTQIGFMNLEFWSTPEEQDALEAYMMENERKYRAKNGQ